MPFVMLNFFSLQPSLFTTNERLNACKWPRFIHICWNKSVFCRTDHASTLSTSPHIKLSANALKCHMIRGQCSPIPFYSPLPVFTCWCKHLHFSNCSFDIACWNLKGLKQLNCHASFTTAIAVVVIHFDFLYHCCFLFSCVRLKKMSVIKFCFSAWRWNDLVQKEKKCLQSATLMHKGTKTLSWWYFQLSCMILYACFKQAWPNFQCICCCSVHIT